MKSSPPNEEEVSPIVKRLRSANDGEVVPMVPADEQTVDSLIENDGDIATEDDQIPISQETPENPPTEPNWQEQCAVCMRRSVPGGQLEFDDAPENFKRRTHGDYSDLDQHPVCSLCRKYIDPADDGRWKHGWAAAIFDFLTKTDQYGFSDVTKLVQFLPAELKSQYDHLYPMMSESVRAVYRTTQSKTIDGTGILEDFTERMQKRKFREMFHLLNETAHATVVCPQGCLLFLDLEKELVPANHYFSAISSYRNAYSDPNKFASVSPQGPCVEERLKWTVGSHLIIDPEKGLCVVTCPKDRHSDGSKQFLYVPRQPILGELPPHTPDVTSAVTVVPNFVRPARVNNMNSSSVVLKQRSTGSGLSTFKLSNRPNFEQQRSEREDTSIGFTIENRPEVQEALCNALEQTDTFGFMKDRYNKIHKLTDEKVAEFVETGTYVDKNDAIDMLRKFSGEDRLSDLNSGNPTVNIVHQCNAIGRFPFKMFPMDKKDDVEGGLLIYSIVHMFLHVRVLHLTFLDKLRQLDQEDPLYGLGVKLQNIVKAISLGKTSQKGQCIKLEDDLKNHLNDKGILPIESTVQEHTCSVIALFCDIEQHTVLLNNERYARAMRIAIGSKRKAVIVNATKLNCAEQAVPPELHNGKWHLLYASNHSFDRNNSFTHNSDFRWSHRNAFQQTRGLKSKAAMVDELTKDLNWNILLYVENLECSFDNVAYLNWSGGQTKLRCARHPFVFMMKEHLSTGIKLPCSLDGCKRPIKWRCAYKFGNVTATQCETGLCLSHSRAILESTESDGLVEPRRTEFDGEFENDAIEVDEEVFEPDPESDTDDHITEHEDYFYLPDASENQITSTRFEEPVNVEIEENAGFASTYLLNDHLGCRQNIICSRDAPVKTQQFLQHINSISDKESVPILYPEAVLFPQHFWAKVNNSIVGALPSIFYSEFGRNRIQNGFASLVDHLRVRIADFRSCTSKYPPYLSFIFDIYVNSLLKHSSVKIALKRGLEHINKAYVRPEDRECNLRFDEVDSRSQIKHLSSLLRDHSWQYFITLTCNDSRTMGVGPIRQALKAKYPNAEDFEIAIKNYLVIMNIAWHRTIKYFFEYLVHSDEKILGAKVDTYWLRFEFQGHGALGNRPHVHAGVSFKEKVEKFASVERIACLMSKIFNEDKGLDRYSLIRDRIVKDDFDFGTLFQLANDLTQHSCARGGSRCMKLQKDGSKKCRVPNHAHFTGDCFVVNNALYDVDTLDLLEKLGLAEKECKCGNWEHVPVPCDELQGGRYNYQTTVPEIRVPTIPEIFIMFQSVTNVQVCNCRFSTAYLCKYCAGVDEKREVRVTSKNKENTEIEAEVRDLYNKKITGANYAAKSQKKYQSESLAKEISLNEMTWFLLDLDFVATNVDFVNASTFAPEHRHGIVRSKSVNREKFMNETGELKLLSNRLDLPDWRRFQHSQAMMVHDMITSNFAIDSTTAFSLRAPELLSVNSLKSYLKWFSFHSSKSELVSDDIQQHSFLDAAGRIVKIRFKYIEEVTAFFQSLDDNQPGVDELRLLTESLLLEKQAGTSSPLFNRFVDKKGIKHVVVSYSAIAPRNPNQFLTHLVYVLGEFITDLDLFNVTNLKQTYRKAGLIADDLNVTEEEIINILRRYVMEDLRFLPFSTKAFCRNLFVAKELLRRFFGNGEIPSFEVPLATQRAIKEKATDKLLKHDRERKSLLADALSGVNVPNLPTKDLLTSGKPFDFEPTLLQIEGQSEESFAEQNKALTICREAIDNFNSLSDNHVRNPLIVGPPGAGKTHLVMLSAIYTLSKGMNTVITAVTSERAVTLGGLHFHVLFALPVGQSYLENINLTAQNCLAALARNEVKMAYLKWIDCIVIEEVGLFPSYLIHVMDIVLRTIKKTTAPFGGTFILSCGDDKQLAPIDGEPFWQMSKVFTDFEVLYLKHLVRSRVDKNLQKVIQITRNSVASEVEKSQLLGILKDKCKFVDSWDKVPNTHHRVVSKHEGINEIVEKFIENVKQNQDVRCSTVKALDEMETMPSVWNDAIDYVSNALDRKLKEPREMTFFVGQIMRFTVNNTVATRRVPAYSQGQLCIVMELPDDNLDPKQQSILVKIMPPGLRENVVDNVPADWKEFSVKRQYSNSKYLPSFKAKARRFQFPFAYYVCSTVHRVMGATVKKLATQIGDKDSKFALWDKKMLLVLLSRVQKLDDLILVGSPSATLSAIKVVLSTNDPWEQHVETVLQQCNSLERTARIIPAINRIPSINFEPPQSTSGYVFLVISLSYPHLYRVAQSRTIGPELAKMNDLLNNREESHLRPWALAMYVCGFEKNEILMDVFLHCWRGMLLHHERRFSLKSHDAFALCEIAFNMFREHNPRFSDILILKKCCKPIPSEITANRNIAIFQNVHGYNSI